jgi:hypothetical protein
MEATIGFDLRSIVSDPSWTVDRRTRFLLRRDVPSVRSVDPPVWVRRGSLRLRTTGRRQKAPSRSGQPPKGMTSSATTSPTTVC